MNKQTKLVLGRGIFVFIITIAFGIIIIDEKGNTFMMPKIKEKMEIYLTNNYSEIEPNINSSDITYDKKNYTMKITSKQNKNHYFYIKYSNKEITDTYKNDYLEGKQLLNHIKNEIEKEIINKTNEECEIEISSTLDKFTNKVQERIIKEEDLVNLKFYTINKDLNIKKWNTNEILNEITNNINIYIKNNIEPKSYKFILTNNSDITQSIEITNITNEFVNNKNNIQIISDILNDNNSLVLKESKISYKYLN